MALQGNELMIGNYFLSPIGKVQRLSSIWQRDEAEWWGSDEDKAHFELNTRNPIQLTPEIINSIKPNLSDYGYVQKWTIIRRLEIKIGYSYITTIQFLHEYQNIYFALVKGKLNYTP
jgi:hypothetical protein